MILLSMSSANRYKSCSGIATYLESLHGKQFLSFFVQRSLPHGSFWLSGGEWPMPSTAPRRKPKPAFQQVDWFDLFDLLDRAGQAAANAVEGGADLGGQAGHGAHCGETDEAGDESVFDEILAGLILHQSGKQQGDILHFDLLQRKQIRFESCEKSFPLASPQAACVYQD